MSTLLDGAILFVAALAITAAVLTPLGALVLLQWFFLNLLVSVYDLPALLEQASRSIQFSREFSASPLEALFGDTLFAGYVLVAVHLVLFWLYFAGFEASRLRATPGKKVLGLIVSRVSQDRASFGQTSLRYWVLVTPALIMMITVRLGWLPSFVLVVAANLLWTRLSSSGSAFNDWLSRATRWRTDAA